ncbi:MAG TPA: TrbG/VirB9 family P-type conjugative transfer protein [Candidatus Omnitrophota bacterium]|nr:TrbG/VirB9 family P-type conjugative transfer protein [Candidatus Omnitrophota bacterium]
MRKPNQIFSVAALAVFVLVHASSLPAAESKSSQSNDESAVQDEKPDPLKDRQHFNKLKRSTQNIYKVTMRSTVTFKLQTALGYVSTIDLPEKALKVFVGDQELYKVEVYEKQVLIKPITDEPDAKTNLVIMTASSRLAFDVSVGAPDTADFVLDFRLPQDDETLVHNAFEEKVEKKVEELKAQYQKKEEKLDQKAQEISEEKIKEKVTTGIRTLDLKKSKADSEVQLNLLFLAQVGNKLYLRFSVLNYSKIPYRVLKAFVGIQTYEKRFLGKKESGVIEIPSELKLAGVINPDSYEYGVLVFDYRAMGKDDKPVLRLLEDTPASASSKPRNFEIKGFEWFK